MPLTTLDGYTGFSSETYERRKSYSVYNSECVIDDIKNEIFTRRGERLRMPNFGTRIPDMVYQPLDDYTIATVREDLLTVFKHDPRVDLIDLNILPVYTEAYLMIIATLNFKYLNFTGQMSLRIEFENQI